MIVPNNSLDWCLHFMGRLDEPGPGVPRDSGIAGCLVELTHPAVMGPSGVDPCVPGTPMGIILHPVPGPSGADSDDRFWLVLVGGHELVCHERGLALVDKVSRE